jgi:diacylglycerol kinase family enzyme
MAKFAEDYPTTVLIDLTEPTGTAREREQIAAAVAAGKCRLVIGGGDGTVGWALQR